MRRAFIYLVIIFIVNLPSMYFGWYIKWWWIDMILHFSGGFFVAMFMYHYLIDRLNNKDILKNIVIVVGTTVLIGVLWEFAEYIANQTLINWTYQTFKIKVYFMGDLKDTILDLFMDIIGSLAFCFYSLDLFPNNFSTAISEFRLRLVKNLSKYQRIFLKIFDFDSL